jgi:hypothetical protein
MMPHAHPSPAHRFQCPGCATCKPREPLARTLIACGGDRRMAPVAGEHAGVVMTTLAEIRAALTPWEATEIEGEVQMFRRCVVCRWTSVDDDNMVHFAGCLLGALPVNGAIVHLQPDVRLVRVTKVALDEWGTRTFDGRRLTAEWGEPDDEDCYTPTFTATDDGSRIVTAESLTRALRQSGLSVVQPPDFPFQPNGTAAIFAALAAEGAI